MLGPPATSLVPPISHTEYIEAVRQHVLTWPDPTDALAQGEQTYNILTMCRGLRTWRTGEHVSKREAARWASEELPEHADLNRDAMAWRAQSRDGVRIEDRGTREATRRFVNDVRRLVE